MSWKEKYQQWLNYPQLEDYLREELTSMTSDMLEDAFYTDLQFGTGGMRGIIGAGTNRMNIYTIRKANMGFAKYLLTNFPDAKERGIVIAYDNRRFSKEFAFESARVMASFGIKAYVFEDIRPTPVLSFALRHLQAVGGIVITASHNPPEYNGYKVYDEYGCQLVPHLADEVIKYVSEVEDVFSLEIRDLDTLKNDGLIEIIGEKVDEKYLEMVKTIQINPDLNKDKIKIVFTPLHGTANVLGNRLLSECGYKNVYPVESQTYPDPEFSTVKSPNPENREAFALAIKLGEEVNADMLIATDPDADRVGIAVKHHNGYQLLTGNQTGALLLNYILSNYQEKHILPKAGVVFNTIVTSNFGITIAKGYGLEVESTLTGFKFIGNRIKEIEKIGKQFVFGYEESYGYLLAPFVRDKDSLQALLMCVEMANYYKLQGKTLVDVLEDLYQKYGYFSDSLININLSGIVGKEKIAKILDDFRTNKPKKINNLEVESVEDYLLSEKYVGDKKSKLDLPKENVIKVILNDGSWFALRPSGTEPKLKIYIGVVGKTLEESETKNINITQYVVERIEMFK